MCLSLHRGHTWYRSNGSLAVSNYTDGNVRYKEQAFFVLERHPNHDTSIRLCAMHTNGVTSPLAQKGAREVTTSTKIALAGILHDMGDLATIVG